MPENKSRISQLQTVGEEALGKLASNDVARKLTNNDIARSALQSAMNLKDRAEKAINGYEELEKRLDEVEKRLADLEGKKVTAKPTGGTKPSSPPATEASPESPTGAD